MNDVLSLENLLRILRRRWFVVALVTLLGPGFGLGLAAGLPKTYVAKATILVIAKPGSDQSPYPAAQFAEKQAGTFPFLIASPAVLDSVRSELKVDTANEELDARLTAANVVGTPIIEVTGSGPTAAAASDLANAAANGLVAYALKLSTPQGGSSSVGVDVVAPALVPQSPTSPRRLLLVLLGAILGVGLGIAAAILVEARARRRARAANAEPEDGPEEG